MSEPGGGPGATLDLGSAGDGPLAPLVHDSNDAIITKDRDAIIRSWNPAAERMYGYSAEEAIGQPISIIVPPDRAGEDRTILARILDAERVDHYETERLTKDGRLIMISLTVSPVRDETGEIVGASVIARDITDRHRAADLAVRLQEITAELARELDPEVVLDLILNQIVAAMGAAAGALGLVEGDDIVLAGHAGYSASAIAEWERFPLSADTPMARAIGSGKPIWEAEVAGLNTDYPGLGDARVRYRSLAVLPLGSGPDPYGAIALSFDERRDFDVEERAFLAAATQQAANALERASAYELQRIAEQRQRLLGEVGELLASSLDPDEALGRLAEAAVEHIADWCGIDLIDEEQKLHNVAVAHAEPAFVELARDFQRRYPADPEAQTGAPNVIRTGRPELYPEVTDEMLADAAGDPEHLRLMRELGIASAMIVPLKARGRVMGAMTLVASDPERGYDETDVEFAQDLARRAALAIDNATLFRREHEAALTLQRSLLPRSLPEIEGIELAALYEPAAPGLEVGGDWYEVSASEGRVSVTIGDVAGRGIRAAAIMGRIRSALRAYVLDGHGPAEALRRLDHLMQEAPEMEMATILHLDLDLGSRTGTYVRAGHPPGLLRKADGEIVELGGGGTPPLGILPDIEYREHRIEIPPGSLLLLFTDGLIERRNEDLIVGMGRIREALSTTPSGARASLDALARAFRGDMPGDDVAMLALAMTA